MPVTARPPAPSASPTSASPIPSAGNAIPRAGSTVTDCQARQPADLLGHGWPSSISALVHSRLLRIDEVSLPWLHVHTRRGLPTVKRQIGLLGRFRFRDPRNLGLRRYPARHPEARGWLLRLQE